MKKLLIVLVLLLAGCGAPGKSAGCGSVGPTCDAVPKADGVYKVSGEGAFSTGIMTGWIGTPGRRKDADVCVWERLNGPYPNRIEMTIARGRTTSMSAGELVQIQPGDAYFWSRGCQPWVKLKPR